MFYDHLKNEQMISGREPRAEDKGEYMGECNRTVCTNRPAEWYNHSTRYYYCVKCAKTLNEENYSDAMKSLGHELCSKGEHNPET